MNLLSTYAIVDVSQRRKRSVDGGSGDDDGNNTASMPSYDIALSSTGCKAWDSELDDWVYTGTVVSKCYWEKRVTNPIMLFLHCSYLLSSNCWPVIKPVTQKTQNTHRIHRTEYFLPPSLFV